MKEKANVYLVQEGAVWSTLQAAIHNAIVQVFAQIAQFDWCEPYRIDGQFENYGSGFFIDEEGHFVTNTHVVEGAKHVWIQIPALGKEQLDAYIVSICPDRDIALLKISDSSADTIRKTLGSIQFLTFGDSDYVQRADGVLVLGYPLGQSYLKSTTGVVSGQEFIAYRSYLQITAPVNPGSSGCPLLNSRGQVIGIAVAMIPVAQNVGYAIPINELAIILDDLKKKNFIRKLQLGVRFVYANDEKAVFLKNPLPAGLYIAQVFPGMIADRLGLQEGDMLYGFNDFRIDCYGEARVPWSLDYVPLFDLISRVKVGDEILLVVYRNGERKDLTGRIEEIDPPAIRFRYPGYEEVLYDVMAGLVIMELTENHLLLLLPDAPELFRFSRPEYRMEQVLVVTNIIPGSYAHQLRSLNVGSIITMVNDEVVRTIKDWRKAIMKSVKSGFISIKTDNNVLVVFSLQKVLQSEKQLSELFVYPLSETIKKLETLCHKGKVNGKNKKTT